MNKKMNIYRSKAKEFVSKEFQGLKSKVYKHLWSEESSKSVFHIQDIDSSIIVDGDSISFDSGKTFVNRREEKQIDLEFSKLEERLIDCVAMELKEKIEEDTPKSKEGDLFNSTLDSMPLEDLDCLTNSMAAISTLKIIDEQIELLREIGGNKEKLFELLDEKRKIMTQLNETAQHLKDSLFKDVKRGC